MLLKDVTQIFLTRLDPNSKFEPSAISREALEIIEKLLYSDSSKLKNLRRLSKSKLAVN